MRESTFGMSSWEAMLEKENKLKAGSKLEAVWG